MNREEKMAKQYGLMFRDYPDAVTPEQLRQMLGIGRRKAYDLLKSGALPSIRMGRLYRIPKVLVIDFLCGNTQ
ncbi:helix-turn-helix domain-containing protein [Oscillibacter sp. GMB15532]|uniref:helix-turn-helix domain-containing protein n=1 Tax=Oscillibacter sp. GMB15532 TaxID=3230022 RepID=UPI0034DDF0E1